MSSRKEYEALFRLSAELGRNFTGTFSSAQRTIAAAQKEIEALNKSQGQIAAYQKQQQAVDASKQKLETYKQQLANVRKEMEQSGQYSSTLANKELDLQAKIEKAENAIAQKTDKLNQMGAALNKAGVDTSQLQQESERLAAQLGNLKKSEEQASDEAANMGTSGTEAITAMNDAIAATGIVIALKKVTEAFAECAEAAEQYEYAMAKIESIADGAQIEEMAAGLVDLSDASGESSASLAEAAYQAISAGIDAKDAVEFTQTATQLAIAGFTDSAAAVDVLTTAINAYGLSQSEAEAISSKLIVTQNLGKITVDQLAQYMGRVIPSASAYNVSIDQLCASYALLTKNGASARFSTTYLTSMLNELADDGSDVAKILKEQTGQTFSVLMAEGKSLGDVLDVLGESVGGNATAFGNLWSSSEASTGALSLFNGSAKVFNETLQAMETSSGTLSSAYETMENTGAKALQRMQSEWQNLKITVGDAFTPALEVAYDVLGDVIGAVSDLAEASPATVAALGAFVSTVGVAVAGLTAYTGAAKLAAKVTTFLGSTVSPVMAVTAAVGLLTAAAAAVVTVEAEANKEITQLIDNHREAAEVYADAAESIDDEGAATQSLVSQLEELNSKQQKTNADKQLMASLCSELNESVPGLALAYNAEADSLTGLTGSLDAYIKKQAEAKKNEKNIARMEELYGELQETSSALDQAQAELAAAQADYDKNFNLNGAGDKIRTYSKQVDELTAQLSEEQGEYDELTKAVDEYRGMLDDVNTGAVTTEEQIVAIGNAISNTELQMQTLIQDYNEAYAAAFDSLNGQYELWDKVSTPAATSAATLSDAIQSQAQYWAAYNTNLDNLTGRTGDIEGLAEMIASFADGSDESVAAVAGMANASDSELQAMVQKWQDLQQAQKEAAGSIADLQTNFTDSMNELKSQLEGTIGEMNLSDEAATSAEQTIQGFIDGASGMLPDVQKAYAAIGKAAKDALYKNNSDGTVSPTGYASGTENAEPGVKLVGENGPELMMFGGGEKVLNSAKTKSILGGVNIETAPSGGNAYTMNISFNITGGNAKEVAAAVDAKKDELADFIVRTIEERESEKERRNFR